MGAMWRSATRKGAKKHVIWLLVSAYFGDKQLIRLIWLNLGCGKAVVSYYL
jgi:hypothetical protein